MYPSAETRQRTSEDVAVDKVVGKAAKEQHLRLKREPVNPCRCLTVRRVKVHFACLRTCKACEVAGATVMAKAQVLTGVCLDRPHVQYYSLQLLEVLPR